MLSQFDYTDAVYSSCIDTNDFIRTQRVQNTCLRLIIGIRKNQQISYKTAEVFWLDMYTRRKLHMTSLSHKVVCPKSPEYLYEKLTII